MDDIVVHGESLDVHRRRLEVVLNRFSEAGLTLNVKKRLRSTRRRIFGHTVSATGLTPLSANVDAVLQVPPPLSTTALSSFLGMTNIYARFTPNYSEVTSPYVVCSKGCSVGLVVGSTCVVWDIE